MQGEVSQLPSEITDKDLDLQNEDPSQAKKGTNAELAMPETTDPQSIPRASPNSWR